MFDLFGPGPNALFLEAVATYHAQLEHWIVEFRIGGYPIWLVRFAEVTDEKVSFATELEMRNVATKMFTDEVRRRLFGEEGR